MAKLHKLTTLIPLEQLEYDAQAQIYNNLELDIVLKMSIMPDCHTGYDLPIGAVALVENHISPSYVGYDIGCGMCLVETGVPVIDMLNTEKDRQHLYDKIVDQIPTGGNTYSKSRHDSPRLSFINCAGDKQLDKSIGQKLNCQAGTLGGGNHFIEIGSNQTQEVVITIHSGSRRPGWETAEYYMKRGRFLQLDSDLGQVYLADMNYMLQYALDNRKLMITNILEIMGFSSHLIPGMIKNMINENHNHAIVTSEGVLHRKGATPAELGQLGVIPGNMRDGVYITRGLGNTEFLSSASHGAGRKLSRRKAKDGIPFDKFRSQMKGIVGTVTKDTLDEAPDAYKDIHMVIEKQDGIVVDVIDYVKPLINVKGGENSKNNKNKDKKWKKSRRDHK